MATFDEHAGLLAALKARLDKASARLGRAQLSSAGSVARLDDAQAQYDQILTLYEEKLVDVKTAAKAEP